jgi:energy-coupling factor transport system permease protein
MIHSLAWLSWLIAAVVLLSSTRNPLYLLLMLLCLAVVSRTVQLALPTARPPAISPWRFALIVVPLGALFNALMVHAGNTILFQLPAGLPLFGGIITLEALVYGAVNGLIIVGLLAAFQVLSSAVPVRALVQRIPRAFYPVAVVVSITLTFVPLTLRQIDQIREAQAVRGHQLRGARDWLPLFMPLLIGGLERALQLAEAMVARGFASAHAQPLQRRDQLGLIIGLIALAGGWLLGLMWGQTLLGGGLIIGGLGLLGRVMRTVGRRTPHTTYRREIWQRSDTFIVCVSLIPLSLLWLPGIDRASLYYYPYPQLTLPDLQLGLLLSMICLLAPAPIMLIGDRRRTSTDRDWANPIGPANRSRTHIDHDHI